MPPLRPEQALHGGAPKVPLARFPLAREQPRSQTQCRSAHRTRFPRRRRWLAMTSASPWSSLRSPRRCPSLSPLSPTSARFACRALARGCEAHVSVARLRRSLRAAASARVHVERALRRLACGSGGRSKAKVSSHQAAAAEPSWSSSNPAVSSPGRRSFSRTACTRPCSRTSRPTASSITTRRGPEIPADSLLSPAPPAPSMHPRATQRRHLSAPPPASAAFSYPRRRCRPAARPRAAATRFPSSPC